MSELLTLVSPDSSDVSTPLVTGHNMSQQQKNVSRFKVEAAVIEVESPIVDETGSHAINGTQRTAAISPAKVDIAGPMRLLKTPREIKLKFTVMCLFVVILVGTILILVYHKEEPFHYVVGSLTYYVDAKKMVINYDGLERLQGQMGWFAPTESPATCSIAGYGDTLCLTWRDYGKLRINYNANLSSSKIDCYSVSWETYAPGSSIKDCFSVKNSHWYGGSVRKNQNLPIESMNIPLTAFVTSDREDHFGSVVERYWLSSRNISIKVEERSPLLVSMNSDEQQMCLESMYWESIHHHHNSSDSHLGYTICTSQDLLEVFDLTKAFPIPRTIPETSLLSEPLWSLDVDNASQPYQIVQQLHDLFSTTGLVDVRSGFGINEGDLTFTGTPLNDTFVRDVQKLGMRVSAEVTPFVSVDSAAFRRGASEGDLVEDPRGEVPGLTMWGQKIGGVVDFTGDTAVHTYKTSLSDFKQSQGLDSLTFDYGEASYLPYGYQISTELDDPSEFTRGYIEVANSVIGTVIARSAYQNQGVPIVIRTYPKEGSWDMDNGLTSVVSSVINLGLIGYPFVALDLREFSKDVMDKELLLSYMQLSACLPVMQIPTNVVEYDGEVKDLIKKYIDFHRDNILPVVTKLGKEYLKSGLPIIRPLWWLENNAQTTSINSQFLVGDDLLVAPKVVYGSASRQVYLPSGKWFQPDTGVVYSGGHWIEVSFRHYYIPYLTRLDNLQM